MSMITPYNLLRHEIIGLNAKVTNATHEGYIVNGKIIDETRNTIEIETESGVKIIPKNCIVIELKLSNDVIMRVDGRLLISRPEDRVKKKYRIKFV